MSVSPTGSPLAGQTPTLDEASLPQGQCRYILLVPGIKGQRCGCAHFSLSRSHPGASCDCGHMACYHVQDPEPAPEPRELDLLKQRVLALEQQLDQERHCGYASILARVSELEEMLDKSRDEIGQEMRGSYRNITRVWQSVEQLEQQNLRLHEAFRSQADHMTRLGQQAEEMRNRQLELFDADISLEERLDRIETGEDDALPPEREPLPPTPDETPQMAPQAAPSISCLRPASPRMSAISRGRESPLLPPAFPALQAPARPESSMVQRSGGPWTVHISLLPTSSQPFPFERDTNAYKRCLSRGLHRTVVVADSTGLAFDEAVLGSFHSILKGRPWMPLKAKLCDFNQLKGLPMLRSLDPLLVDGPYDMEFLLKHCAVRDPHGNIESLYLAMRQDTLSWHFLRNSPVVVEGLETCWAYDHYLDPSDPFEEAEEDGVLSARHPAGEIVPSLPSLKRAAGDSSRTSSFGSSPGTECEAGSGSRSKIQRTCYAGGFDLKRRIETM